MSDNNVPSRAPGPVDRAFTLLQLVVASPGPVGVRALGRQAGLSPATTSRTLGILTDLGMVERTPSGGARPGPGLTTLTQHVEQSPATLRDRLRPLAADMTYSFGENAAIAFDDGKGILYLASSRLPTAVQVADPTGSTFPFHLVAPGLVAMTAWNDQRLENYLEGPLAQPTNHAVIDPGVIRTRVRQAAVDGHVWTDQELDLEVNGLAVPIHSASGELVAAATLYGPSYRLSPEVRPTLARELQTLVAERAPGLL
jgi:DNA-binding IclR family transcriptional regulator